MEQSGVLVGPIRENVGSHFHMLTHYMGNPEVGGSNPSPAIWMLYQINRGDQIYLSPAILILYI